VKPEDLSGLGKIAPAATKDQVKPGNNQEKKS
jgi:hypothetical protein